MNRDEILFALQSEASFAFNQFCQEDIERPDVFTAVYDLLFDHSFSVSSRFRQFILLSMQSNELELELLKQMGHIPLGCRLKIICIFEHLIRERANRIQLVAGRGTVDLDEYCSPQMDCRIEQLWKSWKEGRIHSSDYFDSLNRLVSHQVIDLDSYLHATNMLLRGGSSGESFITQFSVKFPSLQSHQVMLMQQSLLANQEDPYLVLWEDAAVTLATQEAAGISLKQAALFQFPFIDFAGNSQPSTVVSSGPNRRLSLCDPISPTSSSPFLFWISDRDKSLPPDSNLANEFSISTISIDKSNLAASDLESSPLPTTDHEPSILELHHMRILCLQGSVLRVDGVTIDVDKVVALDAAINCPTYRASPLEVCEITTEIVFVIEGRLLAVCDTLCADLPSNHVFSVQSEEDGKSEYAGNYNNNNSPNGGGQEESNQIIPDFSFVAESFLVTALCHGSVTVFTSLVKLSEQLLSDQRIKGIKLASKCFENFESHPSRNSHEAFNDNLVIVYGLHGNLATYSYHPRSHTPMNSNRRVQNLVPDFTNCRDYKETDAGTPVEPLISQYFHRHTSVITSVDVRSFDSCSVLCSGDQEGHICVWYISRAGQQQFREFDSLPHTLVNWTTCKTDMGSPTPIKSLHLSKSAGSLVVGLSDRLLLYRTVYWGQQCPISSMYPTERMRDSIQRLANQTTLDCIPGVEAMYSLSFSNTSVNIWRLVLSDNTMSTSSSAASRPDHSNDWILTFWNHPYDENVSFNHVESDATGGVSQKESIDHDISKDADLLPLSSATSDVWSSSEMDQNLDGRSNEVFPALSASVEPLRSKNALSEIQYQHENQQKSEEEASYAATASSRDVCFEGVFHFADQILPLTYMSYLTVAFVSNPQQDGVSDGARQLWQNISDSNASACGGDTFVTPHRTTTSNRHMRFEKLMIEIFKHPPNAASSSSLFNQVKPLLALLAACFQPPSLDFICTALEQYTKDDVSHLVNTDLRQLLSISVSLTEDPRQRMEVLMVHRKWSGILKWLCSTEEGRVGKGYWVDVCDGHNLICSLYLRYCGNKSIAVEHQWQAYLQVYGPYHLRRCSRGLRALTKNIRKIDETANIKHFLPNQIGYISGLQEIYARRVGLGGCIPKEIGELKELRVLSMGNNRLTGPLPATLGNLRHLQRIVLHQNNLIGVVPSVLGELGCIVNLAGNPRLEYGEDVPLYEREALNELFRATKGINWNNRMNWMTSKPVAKWYKVGVLSSHVHSLVMSSNNMNGYIPPQISRLQYLRMIELATMPLLTGPIPRELCQLTTLRRLCICRCGLSGPIPDEIGLLIGLEELQLFGNKLSGRVPTSLGNLVNLKLLSLGEYTGGNDFTPSSLPPCIERLKRLEALFLADCNIKGPLPVWIGQLKELRQLDLQRNNFTGSLPVSVGSLTNLLYLNIKDNPGFGGKLPILELAGLSRLNRLSMVHCSFEDREQALTTLRVALPRCKIWL